MDKIQAWFCQKCEKITEDELPPLRECQNCSEIFVSYERNCPSCNCPFTRNMDDHGCEECNEKMEIVTAYACASGPCEHGLHLTEEGAMECTTPQAP